MAIDKTFDIPIPMQDVQVRWREIQAGRGAKLHFTPVDEQHTRVRVCADDDAGTEVEKILDQLRAAGLSGPEAAGNPGAGGVAPSGAGGGKPGTT